MSGNDSEIWVCGHCGPLDDERHGLVYPVDSEGGEYPMAAFHFSDLPLKTAVVVVTGYGRICRTCQDLLEVEHFIDNQVDKKLFSEFPRGNE